MRFRNQARLFGLLLAALLLLGAAGCAGKPSEEGDVGAPEESVQPTEPTEPVVPKADFDNIPASLAPMEGYYPFVVKFYNTDGELLKDVVPYLLVTEGSTVNTYTLQKAEQKGLVTGIKAYDANGYELDVNYMMTWKDMDETTLNVIPSYAYAFYLKDGTDAELLPLSSADLLQFGSTDNYYIYWGSALLDRVGYGGQYLIYTLEPPAEGGDTAECIKCTIESYSSNSNMQGVTHYYEFLKDCTNETLPLGGNG